MPPKWMFFVPRIMQQSCLTLRYPS
jgi:hypothetical protein